jgi:hypothetical protein
MSHSQTVRVRRGPRATCGAREPHARRRFAPRLATLRARRPRAGARFTLALRLAFALALALAALGLRPLARSFSLRTSRFSLRTARFKARCSAAARLRSRFASRRASFTCLRARFNRSLASRNCCFATCARSSAPATDSRETALVGVVGAGSLSRFFFMFSIRARGRAEPSLTQSVPECHRAGALGLSTKTVDKSVRDRYCIGAIPQAQACSEPAVIF